MLKISEHMLAAFEAQADVGLAARLGQTWHRFPDVLPPVDAATLGQWFQDYAREAATASIDSDDRMLIYVAGRRKIADPSPAQYTALLNLVFAKDDLAVKLQQLEPIAALVAHG